MFEGEKKNKKTIDYSSHKSEKKQKKQKKAMYWLHYGDVLKRSKHQGTCNTMSLQHVQYSRTR